MNPCPDCGGVLELVTDGQVSNLWFEQSLPYPHTYTKLDAVPFLACTECEHCERIPDVP